VLAVACALAWCGFGPEVLLADAPAATSSDAPVVADAPPPPQNLANDLARGKVGKMIRRFSYGAIIVILLLCGLGLPLPEEVPILTSGVLAGMGHMHAWPALAALMIGVMLGDSAMFLLGKRWGSHLFEHRFARRMLTPERQSRIAAAFDKYGALVIFVARFLPGLRAPLFLTAGSMKVKFATFFTMDGLAALLSVPVSFWVAYYFTDRLQEVLALSHRVLYWVLAGVIVLLLIGHVVWDRWRKQRLAAAAVEAAADAPPLVPPADSSEHSV
jgi:membrane protein DedA with SNARE-associated domain